MFFFNMKPSCAPSCAPMSIIYESDVSDVMYFWETYKHVEQKKNKPC